MGKKSGELLGAIGQPYRIFQQGWKENGGFIWPVKPEIPSSEEIEAVNALQVKVSKSVLTRQIPDGEQFFRELEETFLAESGHLSERARQFGLQSLRFRGDHRAFSHVAEGKQLFTSARALARGFGFHVHKTKLEPTTYYQLVLGGFPDQFDILRTEQTQGNNWFISTEEIIEILKSIEHRFGLAIRGADTNIMEFEIQRPPNPQEALWLNQELFRLSSQQWKLNEDYDITDYIVIGWD